MHQVGVGGLIISESNAEAYMGSLHAFLAIYGWRACGSVPAFQAVYGDYSIRVGAEGWDFNDMPSVRALLAQQLVTGHVLGWFDVHKATSAFSSSAGDLRFLRSLCAIRTHNMDYLAFGRMMRPPRIVSRVPYGPRHTPGYPNCSVPAIASSCWRSSNGSVALFVANHHNSSVSVALEIVVDRHWGPLHNKCELTQDANSTNRIVFNVTMNPLSATTAYLHPGRGCRFTQVPVAGRI